MAIIDSIRDKFGKIIYPKTLIKAVYEENTNRRLDNLLGDKADKTYVDTELDKKIDTVVDKGLSTNDYTTTEKNKLSGIEAGANKYIHPTTHLPSIIKQDVNNRFVSDAEKSTWSSKEPAITKKTAFNKDFGTEAGTITEGNDSRLSDARTPKSHTHIKSEVGLGNVDNIQQATKAEFNTHNNDSIKHITGNERTKWNGKQDALGYIPEDSINKGKANGYAPLDSNIKIPLSILPDIAKQQTYVVENLAERNNLSDLIMGEKCYITTDSDSYIWDGIKWVVLAKADWENVNLEWTNINGKPDSNVIDIDDAVAQKHSHNNKSIIDTITQTLIDRWNSAWNHITDSIKHITSAERTKWNKVDNKADKTELHNHSNKTVLDRFSETSGNPYYNNKELATTDNITWTNIEGKPTIATGSSSYGGLSSEVTIPHGLASIPTIVYTHPTTDPEGYLGEVWVRKDATNIYIGNSGQHTGPLDWTAILIEGDV